MTVTERVATKKSRVAKYPVVVPEGVEVSIAHGAILIKGPLGSLNLNLHPSVSVKHGADLLHVEAVSGAPNALALSGTTRALINNMVRGVTKGFERKLILVGVGYRASAQGDKLSLSLGFSHLVVYDMPSGVKAETPSHTEIVIKGIDKQLVGQVSAEIRSFREPEPYKGKGVRYADERVVLKETKKK